MLIDRIFNNFKKSSAKKNLKNFISNIGNSLVEEVEDEITPSDETVYCNETTPSNKNISVNSPLDDKELLEEELNRLVFYYKRAKDSLERKTFDSQVLTITERVLINRASVEINGGFYKGDIFKNYCKGRIHLYAKEHVARIDGQVVVPKDPNINPLRYTSLESVYAFLNIECRFPQACLRDLSMEIEYFSRFKTKEEIEYLESRFSELAEDL